MIGLLQTKRHRRRLAPLAAALAWSIIWIGTLQYAPSAHAHIHHDADEADHHCVVEVFNEGVLLDSTFAGVHAPATRIDAEPQRATAFHPEPAPRLRPPGRAPPIG